MFVVLREDRVAPALLDGRAPTQPLRILRLEREERAASGK